MRTVYICLAVTFAAAALMFGAVYAMSAEPVAPAGQDKVMTGDKMAGDKMMDKGGDAMMAKDGDAMMATDGDAMMAKGGDKMMAKDGSTASY